MNPILVAVDAYILVNLMFLTLVLTKAEVRVNEVFNNMKKQTGGGIRYAISTIVVLFVLTVAFVPLLIKAFMKGE